MNRALVGAGVVETLEVEHIRYSAGQALEDVRAGLWHRAWWWSTWLPWRASCLRTGRHAWRRTTATAWKCIYCDV